jgi:hypothetical protein
MTRAYYGGQIWYFFWPNSWRGEDMGQVKFSFRESQEEFINRYRDYGFKDKSAMVRAALNHFRTAMDKEDLKKSASLYAELYAEDQELKALTDSAVLEWPE